ncbi:MAG: hypothetical protein JNN17_15130 [Verrucomicrobiaceae bacterium]|nr:hypothetical protein [Verrucomicrobiaceae bacterium]
MADKFYSIHIIQASLQAFDVPMKEIREFLDAFEQLAASPEDFANWNKELDSKGMAVLTLLLQPKGKPLAEACLRNLFEACVNHYKITDQEIVNAMRERIRKIVSQN